MGDVADAIGTEDDKVGVLVGSKEEGGRNCEEKIQVRSYDYSGLVLQSLFQSSHILASSAVFSGLSSARLSISVGSAAMS